MTYERLRYVERRLARLLDRVAVNPVRWAVGLFALGYFGGGLAFAAIEERHLFLHGHPLSAYFNGLWWAFITMFTVGYGDFSPKTWAVRSLAYFVVIAGWSALLIMGAALAGRIAERRIAEVAQTPELDDDVDAIIDALEALKPTLQHPLVVEALRSIHAEKEGARG